MQQPLFAAPAQRRGTVERGLRLMRALGVIAVVAVLIFMARSVDWNQIISAKPEAGVSSSEAKAAPTPRASSSAARRSEKASAQPESAAAGAPEKAETNKPAAPPDKSQASGETPAAKAPETLKPSPTATPSKPVEPAGKPAQPVTPPAPEPAEDAAISFEPLDARQGADAGLLTIRSYASARIYIDGQYSGLTPRTIRLTAGEHRIRLMADGYDDWTRRIRIKNRQQIGIMASMSQRAAQ